MSVTQLLLNKPKSWLNIYVNSITTLAQNILSSIKLTSLSNQITIQPGNIGNSLILTCTNPAVASRTITFIDPNGNDSFVYALLAQTLSAKTLTSVPGITFNGGGSQLAYYKSEDINIAWTGPWATTVAGTCRATRIGNVVALTFPDIIAPCTVGGVITITAALPLEYIPSVKQDIPIRITNNSAQPVNSGLMRVNNSGIIDVYLDLSGSVFPVVLGDSGIQSGSITYNI